VWARLDPLAAAADFSPTTRSLDRYRPDAATAGAPTLDGAARDRHASRLVLDGASPAPLHERPAPDPPRGGGERFPRFPVQVDAADLIPPEKTLIL